METVAKPGCAGQHCSICNKAARFLVTRAGKQDPLCTQHFDWLVENTSKDPKFERCAFTCTCNYADRREALRMSEQQEEKRELPEKELPKRQCACGCGGEFTPRRGAGAPQKYAVGHRRRHRAPKAPEAPEAVKAKHSPKVIVREAPASEAGAADDVERTVPAIQTVDSAAVTVNLSEAAMTRWWINLSVQDKAVVFMASFGE